MELEVQPVALKVLGRTAPESSRTSRKPSDDAAGFPGAEPRQEPADGRWTMARAINAPSRFEGILRCQGGATE